MKSSFLQTLSRFLHIYSDKNNPRRRHNDLNEYKIIIDKENINSLLESMNNLAIFHKNIYNDYTRESDFLKFTIRHEFNILSDELFTLFNIIYDEFDEYLKVFKKILRYNEVDFVITCDENMLSFMDKETAQSILQLNLDLMKTAEYAKIDNNLSTIKELLNHSSITVAAAALLCIQNYPDYVYEHISYDRFLKSDNQYINDLANKIKDGANQCSIFDKMAYLHQVPLFNSINYDQLYQLSVLIKVMNFPTNEKIITQGDSGDSLYIITSGEVEILIDDKRVNTLDDGDYFGEISIMADIKRTATVRAISDCTTLKLSTKEFKELIYDNPKISFDVMKEITNRLIENSKIV